MTFAGYLRVYLREYYIFGIKNIFHKQPRVRYAIQDAIGIEQLADSDLSAQAQGHSWAFQRQNSARCSEKIPYSIKYRLGVDARCVTSCSTTASCFNRH